MLLKNKNPYLPFYRYELALKKLISKKIKEVQLKNNFYVTICNFYSLFFISQHAYFINKVILCIINETFYKTRNEVMVDDTLDSKSLTMSMLMTPQMANFSGVVHGGELLKILDQVAYACAARYCGKYAVTLSVDKVLFKNPIKVGSLVTFLARVNYTGNTSMEIGIKVIAEDIQQRFSIHTNSCFFTMVAKEDGKPVAIPQLTPKTSEDIRRYNEAKQRKEIRMRTCK